MVKQIVSLLLFSFCSLAPAWAQEDANATFIDRWLIEPHDYLSQTVLDTARAMDQFFTGPYSEAENINTSYLRAESGITFIDGEDAPRENFSFMARMRLPQTEELFYLEVETLDATDDPGSDSTNREAERTFQDPANDVAAALRFVVAASRTFNFQANLGVRMGIPMDPFMRLRARYSQVFYKWEHRLEEELFYFLSVGWESTTRFTSSRVYSERFMVQLPQTLIYKPRLEAYGLDNAVHVHFRYDKRNGWLWFNGVASQRYGTGALIAQAYYSGLRYRRKLIKNWLLFDIEPQYRWPIERDYRPTPQIKFNLTVDIGYS